jgi:dienelactone hydrolase
MPKRQYRRLWVVSEFVLSMRGMQQLAFASTLLTATILNVALAQTSEPNLPGTQPLTINEPLDQVMVAGISRYALTALAQSQHARDASWQEDASDANRFLSRVEGHRDHLRTMIGAIDERLPATGLEIVATLGGNGILARSTNFTVYAVRWPVLQGVSAEGLLLEPRKAPVARVIALPDADWSPEVFAGLSPGLGEHSPAPSRLAAAGVQVLIPTLVSRADTYSGNRPFGFTNQPHREFIYRQAFPLGRHIIGFEVEKVQAAVDELRRENERHNTRLPIGVTGVGEGGLLALYTAAVDPRIDAALVSGYFQSRTSVWQEPIYRNVWSLLTEFGDAEIASLIAPRPLVIEACAVPEVSGPPPADKEHRAAAAPGRIKTCSLDDVHKEFERAKKFYALLGANDRISLVESRNGTGASNCDTALKTFLRSLGVSASLVPTIAELEQTKEQVNPDERQQRQVQELTDYAQRLMRLSPAVRENFWSKADRSSVQNWQTSTEFYRNHIWEEMIGKLPAPSVPPNVRTRRVITDPAYIGYEVAMDVYPDVLASGILLLPTGMREGEQRPVVVCQHGLEGVPNDTIARTGGGYPYYKAFAAELVRHGFIVYVPQNPYRGGDRFRVIQRQSNPLKRSLFSYIIRQHERTLEWLATLPNVDARRIAFYGLSYGGKTAVRVPPILKDKYALSICSGDFNDWIRKMVTVDDKYGYVFTGEYEMPEWNMAHIASYAELASLMTPRPFMVERGHDDGVAPDEWVASEFAKARRHYDKLGLATETDIEFFNGPHTIHGVETYRFLHEHLNWPETPNK